MSTKPLSDIEIARKSKMHPIQEIADKLGISVTIFSITAHTEQK